MKGGSEGASKGASEDTCDKKPWLRAWLKSIAILRTAIGHDLALYFLPSLLSRAVPFCVHRALDAKTAVITTS